MFLIVHYLGTVSLMIF
jgi:hypothetical protein